MTLRPFGDGKTKKEVGRFSVVGITSTFIDILFYNLAINILILTPYVASMISGSIAMANSFYFNKNWTFNASDGKYKISQIVRFLLVTVIGVYGIQTLVIYFLTRIWIFPGNLAYEAVSSIGLSNFFNYSFVLNNFAKCWGIGFGMVWNFNLYKKWAFTK
ncbi:TPA: hypothetical protein DDW69_02545 [candidate division CPR2 bacterium]|uniref:Putative membrane protein n=1 Tax=candidate division CPR2 bacterium GW2011_GWC1_41_48 TaxID=1618344 RepID=A0A0G0YK26_UNCC2|nr:MAG: Teichoic acid glycosylation protein [candidate division CPR2 bacterium GW2011_GWC2_39_35]KKR27805.1 MAG: Teichoic acid glycosylation protein [candidate division CPR2 bacterium GW2011_GWD2_39_7]KKR29395.1 MAG: Teichoic acid glycosylation protein [candidate division CPR2 bacterium GW2011_GWD1_39_7]KKS09906.1 MAG: putative membrane protein [candidate division CPR2 bacterium GW2011_GWC1_41_48]OGB62275.1 MAG: hypothetical protein A2Y27_00105 [candidate division CPR2 bacterium GWD1_39_7]OGB7